MVRIGADVASAATEASRVLVIVWPETATTSSVPEEARERVSMPLEPVTVILPPGDSVWPEMR
jgi:hypothetical protein